MWLDKKVPGGVGHCGFRGEGRGSTRGKMTRTMSENGEPSHCDWVFEGILVGND